MDSDFISGLPDEVIGKILSLLPTKLAASTSTLSKRWKNLLNLVDSLSFDETMVQYPNKEEEASGAHRFLAFVYKTLSLLSNSPIKTISISHLPKRDCRDEESRVYDLISPVVGRGLLELHLHATQRESFVWLKRDFFIRNTLVKLTLSGRYEVDVEGVFFPTLKSLSLILLLRLDHPDFCRLLDACPVLEDLYIVDADDYLPPCCGASLESESIKRLVIFNNRTTEELGKEYFFYITAPSLVYLDYSSYISDNYQLVDLDLLVEVRLNLLLWDSSTRDYSDDDTDEDDGDYFDDDDTDDDDDDDTDEGIGAYYLEDEPNTPLFGDVTNLLEGISNITTLHLSPDTLEVFHFCCKSMPVFNNLLNLSIESKKDKGWQVMPLLLKSCPNLHTLAIKGLMHRVTNRCGDACVCISEKHKKKKIVRGEEEEKCCLWTCEVKVLEILKYVGSLQELKQMRHFLGNLRSLETVKVNVKQDNINNNNLLEAYLLALPRVSSKCSIQFF